MSASPKRRKAPAERRQEILEAAAGIALTSGLEAVTKREVADRLGCAPGLVHHYFATVDDLAAEGFTWAMMTEQDSTFQNVAASPTAMEGMRRLLGQWFDENATDHGMLWLDAWSQARRKDGIRQAVDNVMRDGHIRVVELIVRGEREGTFNVVDPDEVAWTILTLLDGVIVHSSLQVNRGLIDVVGTLTALAEAQLGLAPGSLSPARHTTEADVSEPSPPGDSQGTTSTAHSAPADSRFVPS
ncbi:TetR/AcrR family transcriptional regulator [Arthrobacter sp. 24S4-2]|uniref:TetR/AcrR family transcriptional regulator n=1 Tax=Arthrobacter sp. 24S4-2 TaxID=2575374 RepID=UPI001586A7F5|nr:TetR family transcriptional regulator C-terminal domain-containing protein [Arthrobacter sp. 24S4-2]